MRRIIPIAIGLIPIAHILGIMVRHIIAHIMAIVRIAQRIVITVAGAMLAGITVVKVAMGIIAAN